jgi:hypothetical protein
MKRFDNIVLGILIGLLLPIGFLWLFFYNFNPEASFFDSFKMLWGTSWFGKQMLLAAMPDLAILFFVKKQDAFKLGTGIFIGMSPYLIASVLTMIIF